MIERVRIFLTKFRVLHTFLRFLAFLKNDTFNKNRFDRMLIRSMPEGWQKMQILDLGCGPCNLERRIAFHGVDFTCVDIHKPYLKICNKYGLKTVHIHLRDIKTYFRPKSADIIWLLDVIEHLDRSEALRLLDAVDQIARRQIIIFTPVGEVPQDEYDGNKYQQHESAWTRKDLERKGFTCKVLNDYHFDIRPQSKKLSNHPKPIAVSAMWGIKDIIE